MVVPWTNGTVMLSPESFNRIREAALAWGDARERVGVLRALAEAAPSPPNKEALRQAETEADRALAGFNAALGAAETGPSPT